MQRDFFDQILKINAQFDYQELVCLLNKGERIKGTKVINLLDYIIENEEQFPSLIYDIKPGKRVFRARKLGIDYYVAGDNGVAVTEDLSTIGFDEDNSREAPLGKAERGRNNIGGMSYFYAAETLETACAEVKASLRELISIAEFEVLKPMKIIDLSKDSFDDSDGGNCPIPEWSHLMSKIMFQFSRPVYTEDEYSITQVFSDYFNKSDLDGVIYGSFYTRDNNITLFRTHKSYLSFAGSRLVQFRGSRHIFWDYNNKTSFIAEREDTFSTPHAEEQLKSLKKSLIRPAVHLPDCD